MTENRGPHIELYLAEEAIGLVKSLDWNVISGPSIEYPEEENIEEEIILELKDQQGDEHDLPQEIDKKKMKKLYGFEQYFEDAELKKREINKKSEMQVSRKKNMQAFNHEGIRDGDYVYGPEEIQGVYFKKGGLILELDEDPEEELFDEWKNEYIRESVARSSLIKVRKIHSGTYFTKGKLNELGRFNDIILNRDDKIRKYYLKSAQKEKFNPTDIDSESSQMSELEIQEGFGMRQRKIRVIDRFGIILQIFAARAKSRIAQLQIELAWLGYARTMLVRGGAPTFGQLGSIFQGNLMRLDISEVEIKSARGRKSGGSGVMGGEGETQLEIERRKLTDRETKITKELADLDRRVQSEKIKKERIHQTLPLIGLDLLFQTLNTTNKRFRFPNGQNALMLDTIGFITNLPHGLVESFKATLDEIHFADILVHVRDISHPYSNYQRDTVLKVLKEIGVSDDTLSSKYVEVWNKIDLIQGGEDIMDKMKAEQAMVAPQYPVIMMSCLEGLNKDLLMSELQEMSSKLMGKKLTKITYKYSDHDKIQKWLFENANISQIDDFEFDDDSGDITINIPIDDVVFQQYLKRFHSDQFEQEKNQKSTIKGLKGRLTPPPGW
ncbi:gtp-binding protein [Stylonychia lemnae]|uniref:Gtp-binding protein n=1 Tax=Stylonychia lemnae TaxID=5949 RepID=A0A078B127_STYLE|nr:gtp-binding protein [Stylonychia lemnae]|eukprot:CDW87062.1 gtp-binding protein [Stylonychia lemnae]